MKKTPSLTSKSSQTRKADRQKADNHSTAGCVSQGMCPVGLEYKRGLMVTVSLRGDDCRRTSPAAEFADKHIISYPGCMLFLGWCEDGVWHQQSWT